MVKIESSFNGHLENCVCKECHIQREIIVIIRGDKKRKC